MIENDRNLNPPMLIETTDGWFLQMDGKTQQVSEIEALRLTNKDKYISELRDQKINQILNEKN